LSHDGPGYHARGADPLDDPEQLGAIIDLWARLKPLGRMSVNAMMHRDNQSRADVQAWLQARFGADVPIGEGAYIDPYDEGGMAAVLRDPAEHMLYRARAFTELRQGRVANFSIARQKIQGFIDSIRNQRPASSVGQKCGMDKADNLAVDLAGNVITCQNVSAKAVAPNGQAHKIGHLSDLPSVGRLIGPKHGNYVAFSHDQGATWTQITQVTRELTTSYVSVREVQPGRLLLVYDKYWWDHKDRAIAARFIDVKLR
ncbi:MAG: hypothetical protein EBT98_06575, partial [Opitutaceae bacterium]|nr:hypothetical protein [Opitutaceae bacterium]